MQRDGLFRKQALKHIASPDQLDQVITITDPRGWVAIIALGIIVAAIVLWSLLGRVPVTITGGGVFQPSGGLPAVVAPISGQVVTLEIIPGQQVEQGQVVGSIQGASGDPVNIVAPEAGTVVSVATNRYAPVTAGAIVGEIDPANSVLIGVLFVPAEQASVVTIGMPVQLTPAARTANATGFVLGRVAVRGNAPANLVEITNVLGSESAAEAVFRNIQQPLRLDVALERQDGKLVWTSGDGNDSLIRPGIAMTGNVILAEVAPVVIVIPALAPTDFASAE